nr:DUF4214 domain-containing protein [Aurantimonas sp. DM33-3]
MYQTVFGRVPDKAGLNDQVDTLRGPATESDLANSFANSPEFISRFGGNTVNTAFINAVYQQVLGRTPSAGEVNFYLNSGFSAGRIALAFSESPEFQANVSTAVVGFLDAAGQGTAVYTGSLGGTVNVGTTFTLTTNVDAPNAVSPAINTNGTAQNDTYNAVNGTINTLTAADQIDGGAGTDTLNLLLDANGSVASLNNVKNVEIFNIQDTANGSAIDFGSVVGEQQVWNDRGTGALTFANVADGTTVGLRGNGNAVLGNVAFEQVTAGAAVNIAIDGGVGTTGTLPTITNGLTGGVTTNATTATISSTGAANTVGAIDLTETAGSATAGVSTLNVNAATNLTATLVGADYNTNGADLKVSGAASSVNLGANGVFKTIDASGMTAGGLTVGLSSVTNSFKGGAGNDVVTTAGLATSVAASSINAGSGTADRLVVGASADVDTAAEAQRYAGFEVLDVGTQTSDVSLFTNSSINALRIGGAATVSNLTAAQAGAITQYANGSATINVAGAGTVGQIDTVKITADDGATATSTITLGTPVLANVERLELNAVDNITVTALTSAEAVGTLVLSGAGTQSITSGAITPEANGVVDGSAATGALTLDFGGVVGATTTSATSFIGGAANDTITTTGGAADIVNGKGGLDTIIVTKDAASSGFATVQSEVTTAANSDIVLGFVTGENKFDYNGALVNGTGTSSNGIQGAEIATGTTFANAIAAGNANNAIVFQATTDLTGAQETALDTLVGGAAGSGFTAANINAVKAAFLATGGALNGTIANLDATLGAGDSALVQFETDTDTVVFRITNTDTAVANTLTADEVQLVGVFDSTASIAAGDYI